MIPIMFNDSLFIPLYPRRQKSKDFRDWSHHKGEKKCSKSLTGQTGLTGQTSSVAQGNKIERTRA